MGTETGINFSIGLIYFAMLLIISALPILYFISRARILKKDKEKNLVAFTAASEAEEKQRERIAQTLHDEVVPLLSVIIQNFEIIIKDIKQNKLELESIEENKTITLQAIQSVKDAALELIPKELIKYGLLPALQAHLKKQNLTIAASLENHTPFQILPFTKQEEVHVYRLSLELIQNLRKHDHIENLTIKIEAEINWISFKFLHDGKGISDAEIEQMENRSTGLGLKSIRSRLIMLKAGISYIQSEAGSAILIKIPIANEKD